MSMPVEVHAGLTFEVATTSEGERGLHGRLLEAAFGFHSRRGTNIWFCHGRQHFV